MKKLAYQYKEFKKEDKDYKSAHGSLKLVVFYEDYVSDTARYYEKGFFEHVINDHRDRIDKRLIIGLYNENPQRFTQESDFAEGKVCVVIDKLYLEGTDLIAELIVLKTISGDKVHEHALKNLPLRASLRAVGKILGSTKYQDEYYVVDKENYHLEAIDIMTS